MPSATSIHPYLPDYDKAQFFMLVHCPREDVVGLEIAMIRYVRPRVVDCGNDYDGGGRGVARANVHIIYLAVRRPRPATVPSNV